MHLKVFVKLKKNTKNPLVWAKNQKNQKTQKTQKKPKKTQKTPLGWVFKKKPGFFPTLPQTDKHLPQSPFTGQFFLDDDILYCLLCVLSFSGLGVTAEKDYVDPFIKHNNNTLLVGCHEDKLKFHNVVKNQSESLAPLLHDFKVSTIGLLFSLLSSSKKDRFFFTSVIHKKKIWKISGCANFSPAHGLHFIAFVAYSKWNYMKKILRKVKGLPLS